MLIKITGFRSVEDMIEGMQHKDKGTDSKKCVVNLVETNKTIFIHHVV